ncbi:Ig-like domain-containing protein [Marinobacterium aestuariivivens]|uniref:Ig-like domain-containing protein n=2 Tax=Marinobacterium aestuariivivens TaxID=1698799 RepID=A0ABW2A6Y8_9GAMM
MAQLDQYVPAGRYYLQISGVGSAASPYSDYGSLGFYYISGTVQPAVTDDTPPTVNSAGWWATLPAASSTSSIDMAVNAASDDSGVVEYWFQCVTGGSGCGYSGWQGSTQYSATGLAPGTLYSFQVKARDAYGNETAWSSIQSATTYANQVPVANDDSASTDAGVAVSIPVLANDTDADGDSLNIETVGASSDGSVVASGGELVYTPAAGFSGTTSFTYTVTDGLAESAPATVTVTVHAVNGAPVAADDSASVGLNSSVVIDVLANDSDPDGDSLTIASVTGANKGSLTHDGSQVTYSSGNRRGGDSFTYTVIDSNGGSATATVSVNISPDGGGDSGGGDGGDTGGGGKCHPKKGC